MIAKWPMQSASAACLCKLVTILFAQCLQRILAVKYAIPPQLRISVECQDLLARIFVAQPAQRITLSDIKRHPWFLRNLPVELAVSIACHGCYLSAPRQQLVLLLQQ